MPHCSSLRQLKHRVDSQPLVERKLSISVAIGGHRWLLSLPSTTHTAPAPRRPSHVRVASPCGRLLAHPVWPAHVARICSSVRIMLALLLVGRWFTVGEARHGTGLCIELGLRSHHGLEDGVKL